VETALRVLSQFRESEIEQLHTALRQHDVRWFQVAVRDSAAVSPIEGVSDLDGVFQRLIHRQRSSRNPIRERLAFEILHNEVCRPLVTTDIVKRAYMGMIQCRNRLCFPLESRLQFRVVRELF
jgi:hypothetical protein